MPERLPDLFAGSPLLILGRYPGPSRRATARPCRWAGGRSVVGDGVGRRARQPGDRRGLGAGADPPARGSLRRGSGDRPALEQAIVALSLRFQVLCRFTAYVAVDRAVADVHGQLYRITQPVEQPEGWSARRMREAPAKSSTFRSPAPSVNPSSRPSLLDSLSLGSIADAVHRTIDPVRPQAAPRRVPSPSRAERPPGPPSPPPPSPSVAQTADGSRGPGGVPTLPQRYEFRAVISQGGMGTVYKAFDRRSCQIVRIDQRHLADDLRDDATRARILAAARDFGTLEHPALVVPLDVLVAQDCLWIVSRLIEGSPLDLRLRDERPPSSPEAVALVAELADALQSAHERGIVHGDINPSNILIAANGRPYLVEFQWPVLAAIADRNGLRERGRFLGAAPYIAPEQVRSEASPADPRRDVYALGVVLYELLSGRRPFQGSVVEILRQVTTTDPPPPRSINRSIPRELEVICLRALERDPDQRYPSAGALAEALRALLGARVRPGLWSRLRGRWASGPPPSLSPITPVAPPDPTPGRRGGFWK